MPEDSSLIFVGPKFGQAKADLYRQSDAFILPSLSEGLPTVVLEAWAYGKPVVMTPECNLPEGLAAGAALLVRASSEGVAEGLRQLFALSDDERKTMGLHGQVLVEARFAWPEIADEMRSVYEWMLGNGSKPGCII